MSTSLKDRRASTNGNSTGKPAQANGAAPRSSTPIGATRTRSTKASESTTLELGNDKALPALRKDTMSNVKTLEQATSFLTGTKLWNWRSDESWTTAASEFERALMQLADYAEKKWDNDGASSAVRDGLGALAIVFRDLITKSSLVVPTDSLRPVVGEVLAQMSLAANSNYGTADALAEAVAARIPQPVPAASIDTGALDTIQQRLAAFEVKFGELTQKLDAARTGPTYAQVASQATGNRFEGRPATQQDAIARNDLRERRILIDADPQFTNEWLALSPAHLVFKCNLAIGKVIEANGLNIDLESPEDTKAQHAFRTGKTGVVFSFATKKVADWLKQPDNLDIFRFNFDAGAKLREITYPILVRNLPCALDLGSDEFVDKMCGENSIDKKQVKSIEWLKAAEKRTPDQKSAHALIRFRSPEMANAVLDCRELAYNRSPYRVERLLRDAPRCAKCQRHRHFASKCNADLTCGFCAKPGHHANQCAAQQPSCPTCSLSPEADSSHPAWHRDCPARLRELEKLRQHYPEDFAPRFLTIDNTDRIFPKGKMIYSTASHLAPTSTSGARLHQRQPASTDEARGRQATMTQPTPKTPRKATGPARSPTKSRSGSKSNSRASPATPSRRRTSTSFVEAQLTLRNTTPDSSA